MYTSSSREARFSVKIVESSNQNMLSQNSITLLEYHTWYCNCEHTWTSSQWAVNHFPGHSVQGHDWLGHQNILTHIQICNPLPLWIGWWDIMTNHIMIDDMVLSRKIIKWHQISPYVIKCHHVKLKDFWWFLNHQRSQKIFQFNMVTFGDMSWYVMISSNQFAEVVPCM